MHYLITFAGYGCRLHGDDRGSFHREFGALREEPELESYERALMTEPAYALDERRCAVVARMRQWYLCAAHVRRVVEGQGAPMAAFLDPNVTHG